MRDQSAAACISTPHKLPHMCNADWPIPATPCTFRPSPARRSKPCLRRRRHRWSSRLLAACGLQSQSRACRRVQQARSEASLLAARPLSAAAGSTLHTNIRCMSRSCTAADRRCGTLCDEPLHTAAAQSVKSTFLSAESICSFDLPPSLFVSFVSPTAGAAIAGFAARPFSLMWATCHP